MFAGTPLKIGEEEFIVPPLSLGQLRNGMLAKLQEHDKLLAENKIFEAVALRGEVILAALRRNYPDFSEEKLMAHLDVGNTGPVWLFVLTGSGFAPTGETQAGTTVPAPPGT